MVVVEKGEGHGRDGWFVSIVRGARVLSARRGRHRPPECGLWMLMPAPGMPAVERVGAWVAGQLSGWSADGVLDAVTVVEELVDNAYQFAPSPYAVQLTLAGDGLTVLLEVHDSGFPPVAAWPMGEGLCQVAAVARDWGVRRRRFGKVVWAELCGTAADRDEQR